MGSAVTSLWHQVPLVCGKVFPGIANSRRDRRYLEVEIGHISVGPKPVLLEPCLLQVVSEEDYMNPHIRPWPSRRSLDDQVASI